VVRWGFPAFHARTWFDIVRIVVAVTLRLEVFRAPDGQVLLEQGNVSGVAAKDCNNQVPKDGNHSATTGDHLIREHLCREPIREPRHHKGLLAHGSFGGWEWV